MRHPDAPNFTMACHEPRSIIWSAWSSRSTTSLIFPSKPHFASSLIIGLPWRIPAKAAPDVLQSLLLLHPVIIVNTKRRETNTTCASTSYRYFVYSALDPVSGTTKCYRAGCTILLLKYSISTWKINIRANKSIAGAATFHIGITLSVAHHSRMLRHLGCWSDHAVPHWHITAKDLLLTCCCNINRYIVRLTMHERIHQRRSEHIMPGSLCINWSL